MNALIKTLEQMGQSVSVKEFDSASEMLKSNNVSESIVQKLQKHTIEYVCLVMPEDDDDKDEEINI